MIDLLFNILLLVLLLYYILIILRKTTWSIFTYTLLWLLVYYILLPVINNVGILLNLDMTTNNGFMDSSIVYLVIILVFILSYIVGYNVTPKISITPVYRSIIMGNNKINLLRILAYFLSVFSFISLFIYINGFGGLINAVFYANSVRTGYFRVSYLGTIDFLFFKRFIFLALIPILVYLSEANYRKILDKIVLFLFPAFTLIVLYLLLNRGRQKVIDFILIIVFASLLKKKIIFNRWLLIGVFSSILLLSALNVFFYIRSFEDIPTLLTGKQGVLKLSDYYSEFAHPLLSLNKAVTKNYDYYYFTDYLYGIYGSFFPFSNRIIGKEIVYLNTHFTMNRYESTVPPGIIASGYYNLGVFGVIITAILLGFLIKKLDSFFISFIKAKRGYIFFYAYTIIFSFTIIRTGIPRFYLYDIVFVSFLLLLFLSFQFKKTNKI